MELISAIMFILRIIFSYMISTYLGRMRNIGAAYSFWISLFLTPIVGIIITLCSSKFKGELPKRKLIFENIGIVIFLIGGLVLLMTLGALLSNNSYLEPKFLYSMMFFGSGIFTLGLYVRQKGLGKSFADEYLLLSYKPLKTYVIGNTLDYPEIINFSISPLVIKSGDKISISWDVRKAIKVSISGLGTVELCGSKNFNIHNIHDVQSKIITLYAENDTGVKISKDITLKFKNPIKAKTTINQVESISLSIWFIEKIKQYKSSNTVLSVMQNILPTLIIAISFFIIGRVSVSSEINETKNDKLSSKNTVVVLPEFTDTLNSPDILRVSSVIRKEDGTIDSVFIESFRDKIYIPHPDQLFVEVNISDLTVYTRLDKTMHYGFRNVKEINEYLSFIFPHSAEFRRKLTDEEKEKYKME